VVHICPNNEASCLGTLKERRLLSPQTGDGQQEDDDDSGAAFRDHGRPQMSREQKLGRDLNPWKGAQNGTPYEASQ